MYVCLCNGVTDKHVDEAVRNGARHVKDLIRELNVASDCARCVRAARESLDASLARLAEDATLQKRTA